MPTSTLQLLGTWADAIPDWVACMLLPVFAIIPIGIGVHPAYGLAQFVVILLVFIGAYMRWSRKWLNDQISGQRMLAWIAGSYIAAVTLTNLLAIVLFPN